jgi:fructose-bisphosphate aldolase, class I
MIHPKKKKKLKKIAKAMVAPGKGILAADESHGNIEKKFAKWKVPFTEENRRAYREVLFTAPQIGDYISGVIMFDETIRHKTKEGKSFVSVLEGEGVLPGIKVDVGLKEMKSSPNEKLMKEMEGLADRLKEYACLGAKFAKARAVITISEGLPTESNIRQNAKDLAAYALECQKAGIVPMVEPEVLMDGTHLMDRHEEVTEKTLQVVFEELENIGVMVEGMILKPNMILHGKESGKTATPEEVAEATIRVLKKVLPNNLPGVTFLSGGQSEEEATKNLQAINMTGSFPWNLTFSFGRALQSSALKAWSGGKADSVKHAHKALTHRKKMNSLATLGKYNKELERKKK